MMIVIRFIDLGRFYVIFVDRAVVLGHEINSVSASERRDSYPRRTSAFDQPERYA